MESLNTARLTADPPGTVSSGSNCPNPFNPKTDISFGLPERREVSLAIRKILGKKVRTVASGILFLQPLRQRSQGNERDGADQTGSRLD